MDDKNKWKEVLQDDDPLNDSQSPFYHATALEEYDENRNRTDSAKEQRARAEKAGFKHI